VGGGRIIEMKEEKAHDSAHFHVFSTHVAVFVTEIVV
jgi:hypothetical protein